MKKFNDLIGVILGGIGVLFISTLIRDLGYKEIAIGFAISSMILLTIIPNIKEVKKDRAIRKGGIEGERKVKQELKELKGRGYRVINGVYLKGNTITQEIDSLIITPKAIFNVETKNYGGEITITKSGDWIRTKYGEKSYLKNPKEQVDRHRKCIKEIVGNTKIVDLVVIANDKTTIEGEKNSKVKVINYSNLSEYIEKYRGENIYNVDALYNKLKSRIKGESNIRTYKDKKERPFYKNLDFIARVSIGIFVVFYVFMGW